MKTKRDMPETRPSSPSSKLNEFIVPTINTISIIDAGIIGKSKVNKCKDENFGNRKSKSSVAATI